MTTSVVDSLETVRNCCRPRLGRWARAKPEHSLQTSPTGMTAAARRPRPAANPPRRGRGLAGRLTELVARPTPRLRGAAWAVAQALGSSKGATCVFAILPISEPLPARAGNAVSTGVQHLVPEQVFRTEVVQLSGAGTGPAAGASRRPWPGPARSQSGRDQHLRFFLPFIAQLRMEVHSTGHRLRRAALAG